MESVVLGVGISQRLQFRGRMVETVTGKSWHCNARVGESYGTYDIAIQQDAKRQRGELWRHYDIDHDISREPGPNRYIPISSAACQ